MTPLIVGLREQFDIKCQKVTDLRNMLQTLGEPRIHWSHDQLEEWVGIVHLFEAAKVIRDEARDAVDHSIIQFHELIR